MQTFSVEDLSICAWFRSYSQMIWEKLNFAKGVGIRLSETTITQSLVLDFWLLMKESRFPISMYESINEKTNGNDLEILIETGKGYLLFPCQAKVLQNQNKYGTISHKVQSTFQIELLINYASKHGGIPIYLLYNHRLPSQEIKWIEGQADFSIEDYGLSVVEANDILERHFDSEKRRPWRIPTFNDLHPQIAKPFHDMICSSLNNERFSISQLLSEKHSVKYYSRNQIENHPFWQDLMFEDRIGYITHKNEIETEQTEDSKVDQFAPRFRLVLHNRKNRPGVYYLG